MARVVVFWARQILEINTTANATRMERMQPPELYLALAMVKRAGHVWPLSVRTSPFVREDGSSGAGVVAGVQLSWDFSPAAPGKPIPGASGYRAQLLRRARDCHPLRGRVPTNLPRGC